MVATRGNRDHSNGSKFNLPTRECRRATTLEEPDDEIFWESDDTIPRAKVRKKSIVTFATKPEEELANSVRHRRHSVHSDDMVGVNGHTDTDDDLFNNRKTRFSISSKRHSERFQQKRRIISPAEKEFGMNGDDEMSDKSDTELAPRRSSRQRKVTSYSESWLVGDKKFRGYPSMVNNSESDECRTSLRRHKYQIQQSKDSNGSIPPRRSQRYKSKLEECNRRSKRYCKSLNISELSPQTSKMKGYHIESEQSEDEEEEEYDDDDDDDKKHITRSGKMKKDIKEELLDKSDKSSDHGSPKKRGRPKKQNESNYAADAEDTDDDLYQGTFIRRSSRSMRNLLHSHPQSSFSKQKLSESECEEKMEVEDQPSESAKMDSCSTRKSAKGKVIRDEIIKSASQYGSSFMKDIPKRVPKPVSRLSYDFERKQKTQAYSDEEIASPDEEDDGFDDNRVMKYPLRKTRAKSMKEKASHMQNRELENFLKSPARKRVYNKKKVAHSRISSSTSSSSDERNFDKRKAKAMYKARSQCLPMNMKADDLLTGIRERPKVGGSLADIDPMMIDKSVNFTSIGGLSHHIRSLKEMIIFPFMYPEIFHKFDVSPPRGVLFYGPPGTGKTLVARALANECSQEDKKISFFMRKGADCLSKWVGESERQLRLLFDQAYQMRPSIIFFDEIDGLAPVRSSRQDQIHSSIVSTLLALMDGLDSREEIVVIGATNRIDAIDSALRRPGRFDREFHFPLPSLKARQQILSIHTQKWEPALSKDLIKKLAEQTVGYCGADLRSLCAEATLCALRNKYPQIYSSNQKLLLDPSKISIKFAHFRRSLASIVPAGQRAMASPGRKLNKAIMPLLNSQLEDAIALLKNIFPHGFFKPFKCKNVYRPRLLLSGRNGQGQTSHLAPAVIHSLEKICIKKLDLPSLHSVSALQPEEACAQILHDARRSTPSIIFMPMIDKWWWATSESIKNTLVTLLNEVEPSSPLLLLATSDTPYAQLDPEIRNIFSEYRKEVFSMANPEREERKQFFHPVFYVEMLRKPKVPLRVKRVHEVLPLAPPPEPRSFNKEELRKLEYVEEASLRELRIFLRQICAKLAKNKMFYLFTKPVDLEEVPDYCEIISTPMDLETMMTKIDGHYYDCAEDFLKDIDLICSNALEYNPDKSPEDKLIRHKACTLRDTAYAYIKAEMDTDFEDKCREIRKQRKKRKYSRSTPRHLVPLLPKKNPTQHNEQNTTNASPCIPSQEDSQSQVIDPKPDTPNPEEKEPASKNTPDSLKKRKHRKAGSWAKGHVPKKKRFSADRSKQDEGKEEAEKITKETANDPKPQEFSANSDHAYSTLTSPIKILMPHLQNGLESESTLYNGEVSTEDSRESLSLSQPDDLLNTAFSPITEASQAPLTHRKSHSIDENDSIVCDQSLNSSPVKLKDEVIIDTSHLDAVFTSCITATEGCTIEQLHYLYTQLMSLTLRHNPSLERSKLLHEAESEIRRFAQYLDNH